MTDTNKKAKGQDERSVGQSELMDWLDPVVVAQAIDDEHELTGDMPEEMWQALRQLAKEDDKEGMTEALRIMVRLTKQSIKDRIGV